MGDYIRGAWAAFAKDPVQGLTKYGGGWPQYSPQTNSLIRLAYNNQTGINVAMGDAYDLGCIIPPFIGGSGSNGTIVPPPTVPSGAGKFGFGSLLAFAVPAFAMALLT